MNLSNIILEFSGILIIGDIHSDYESLVRASEYANNENLFLISLGDLVDRGTHPFETVELMYSLVKNKKAGFIIGNHDNKHYRNAIGNKVKFSKDGHQTLRDVGEFRLEKFYELYKNLITNEYSDFYHYIDNYIFVHGASHYKLWNYPDKLDNDARSRALYGEVTGKYDHTGMPERIYQWVDEIPNGKTVIVGHDRKAIFDVSLLYPMVVRNLNGGCAMFMDTSCGKGGILSGAILKQLDTGIKFEKFIQFK